VHLIQTSEKKEIHRDEVEALQPGGRNSVTRGLLGCRSNTNGG
jgi:hypothetical protein